jgi:hypothetical protein
MHYSQSPPLAENEWLTAGARDPNMRPVKSSIHSPRSSSLKHDQVASDRPSVGRRIFRTLTQFFIAVLIGVGSTLAWQSHGDAARQMVVARAPTLAWLLSVSTTKSPAVAATSPDPVQQLVPLAFNLDAMRRSVEQLAAKQDQMAQNIAMGAYRAAAVVRSAARNIAGRMPTVFPTRRNSEGGRNPALWPARDLERSRPTFAR